MGSRFLLYLMQAYTHRRRGCRQSIHKHRFFKYSPASAYPSSFNYVLGFGAKCHRLGFCIDGANSPKAKIHISAAIIESYYNNYCHYRYNYFCCCYYCNCYYYDCGGTIVLLLRVQQQLLWIISMVWFEVLRLVKCGFWG